MYEFNLAYIIHRYFIFSPWLELDFEMLSHRVHDKGAKIFMQLWHAGRAVHSSLIPGGKQPVSSSPIPITDQVVSKFTGITGGPSDREIPRALTLEEIPIIVEQFRKAAANALRARFDGIEVHAANGYLIDELVRLHLLVV